jgi:chromosome condensin MukBEF ATPase and DNA-binding subunit MukB
MQAQRQPTSLQELVTKYLAAAGGYGKPAAIASLGGERAEIERALSAFDEDYHISRFLHFQNAGEGGYNINGFPQTHLVIDSEIQSVL